MRSSSIARAKCYLLLQGLERSLAENLLRNFEIDSKTFLTVDERSKALQRMHEDLGETSWGLDDIEPEDLLSYLDLGDLVNLLNRHVGSVKNALPDHVSAATQLVTKSGALTIRKRVMHPVRPLEPNDLPTLSSLARRIQIVAPSLIWGLLTESVQQLFRDEAILEVSIPSFWTEEPPVIHNLPVAEFDDTGFIGRHQERKQLKSLLESDHRVITVVGEAGIGKTALALRVCNDLLEHRTLLFDRVVWVSLKTKYLTPEGIREISDAVDSIGMLIDTLLKVMKADSITRESASWDRVLEHIRATKTLLVIDNLETIGEEIRDLLVHIPSGSKILLTSRVGLGEIELRYELLDFAPKDATHLFRTLVTIYNYTSLKKLKQDRVERYCKSLDHNPLLIKWFVQAVGRGADPETILSNEGFNQALNFCYASIYDRLEPLAKQLVSVLLAARRELTKAQLQDLTEIQHVPFVKSCQDLIRSSIVERVFQPDGTVSFQIGRLVYEYLSRNYPPDDALVATVREKIRAWQLEQDKSIIESETYRYGPRVIHVETADERISAQHLHRVLQASDSKDFSTASAALDTALQLTPTWWEIHRVQARILEAQNRPVYEVEEAFERSIKFNDNDVNRYHYAVYLIRHDECERALEQIENALGHTMALTTALRGLRGLALMRLGRYTEAIAELEVAWSDRSKSHPINIRRARGTQLSEAYRRSGEQMLSLGNTPEAVANFSTAIEKVNETITECGCDQQLVETAVNILGHMVGLIDEDQIDTHLAGKLAKQWDQNQEFRRYAIGFRKTLSHFQKNPRLEKLLPAVFVAVCPRERFTGRILKLYQDDKNRRFGFIECDTLGKVHFDPSSLVSSKKWRKLKPGNIVTFEVIHEPKGLHAVTMEIANL